MHPFGWDGLAGSLAELMLPAWPVGMLNMMKDLKQEGLLG